MKKVKSIVANNYMFTYNVKYDDGSVKVFNLDTMPAKLINAEYTRINTEDSRIYYLIPKK